MNCEDDEYHVFSDVDISDLYGFEFTRLTEMVREHYSKYLEKQLTENYQKCHPSVLLEEKNVNCQKDRDDECHQSIKRTVTILEDKALKACMVAQLYQRAMMKIITGVKRYTQEKRLVLQLSKLLNDDVDPHDKSFSHHPPHHHQYTQTEQTIWPQQFNQSISLGQKSFASLEVNNGTHSIDNNTDDEDKIMGNEIESKLTLEEKIEVFKKKFIEEQNENNGNSSNPLNQMQIEQLHHKLPKRPKISPQESNTTYKSPVIHRSNAASPLSHLATAKAVILTSEQVPSQLPDGIALHNMKPDRSETSNIDDFIDEIDMELARMFSDEKTELDELFGIDPNGEPDDPQICSILKEIENAKINIDGHKDATKASPTLNHCSLVKSSASHELTKPKNLKHRIRPTSDLSKSVWPCELFMLRRKLSETLAILIDEDYRWLDIIKFEFTQLFGEDSDDEFATYSPSIELDEILIGSCMRRISPWVVKYLMKPLKDGLIGNKFLFKKLAKHLAYSIIMENQYPDEMLVMQTVENYFCLHPSIMSVNDINELNGGIQF